MTVVITVNKRYAASGRALQAKSAASEIQNVKNTIAENVAKSNQIYERKTICGDEFATISSLTTVSLNHRESKKRCYNLINTINVKKHLKGIQAEADATCEKSILNSTMHSQKDHNVTN